MYRVVSNDARSVTGKNIRVIMSSLKVFNFNDFHLQNVRPVYFETPAGCENRPSLIHELTEVRPQELVIPGFDESELNTIMTYLCVS